MYANLAKIFLGDLLQSLVWTAVSVITTQMQLESLYDDHAMAIDHFYKINGNYIDILLYVYSN